jgi:hypothetical protein
LYFVSKGLGPGFKAVTLRIVDLWTNSETMTHDLTAIATADVRYWHEADIAPA